MSARGRSEELGEPREKVACPVDKKTNLKDRFAREWSLYERYLRKKLEIWVGVWQWRRVDDRQSYVACFQSEGRVRTRHRENLRGARVQHAGEGADRECGDEQETVLVHDIAKRLAATAVKGYINHHDAATGIESWIISVNGHDIGELFARHGVKVFARNIRGYLGVNDVNMSIEQSLRYNPSHFWYFNNGVTIACDDAEQRSKAGRSVLLVRNPQIINGQQTTRSLAKSGSAKKASLLVRIIALPDNRLGLVSDVVKATNHQSAIKPSDLVANDPRQVWLERKLRLRGYQYLRKRETKAEARARSGHAGRLQIKKEELAQAVAACELDPEIVRSAREGLFDGDVYSKIFASTDLDRYLVQHWVLKLVASHVRGKHPEHKYAKFFIVHATWQQVGSDLLRAAPRFMRAAESRHENDPVRKAVETLIARTTSSVDAFFRARRGRGAGAQDVYSFYKRRKLVAEYDTFMRSRPRGARARYTGTVAKVRAALSEQA